MSKEYPVSVHQHQNVRAPKVLALLILEELEKASQARAKVIAQANQDAADAALSYYRAAGEKLLEARASVPHGKFGQWIRDNLKISERHARRYMHLARVTIVQNGPASPVSLSDAIRQTGDPNYNRRKKPNGLAPP